jgi:hypothetical protein
MNKLYKFLSGSAAVIALLALLAPQAGAVKLELMEYDQANFSDPLNIDNPFWPLIAGTTFTYVAEEDDECVLNTVYVSNEAKRNFPARTVYKRAVARIVYDVEWIDEDCDGTGDQLDEETQDWYAQDDFGNIWYLGEETIAYEYDDDGNFLFATSEGSWEAGYDGALAGTVVLGDPHVGDSFFQEFYEEEAEDQAKILRLDVSVSTDRGDYEGCMKTKEWTELENQTIEHKVYCPGGDGLVLIEELSGGKTVIVELTERNP